MAAIQNARDTQLAAAPARILPVTLPPTTVVPPTNIGAGPLPPGVTGADGTSIVSVQGLRATQIYADQIDSRGLAIRDLSGNVLFSAGVPLSASRVAGLGGLASQSYVDLSRDVTGRLSAATHVTDLGGLAFANTIVADKVLGGSFVGKSFTGGSFSGSQFDGARFVGAVANIEKAEVWGYIEVKGDLIARNNADVFNLAVNGAVTGNLPVVGTVRCNSVGADWDMRTVNLYATGPTALSGALSVGGAVSIGSSLTVDGSVGGSGFSSFLRQEQTRWAEITENGTTRTVRIKLGAL